MVFSSLEFLCWFLPFFLLIYFLLQEKYRNFALFAFSMVFYIYGTLDQPWYILLLPASIGLNYLLSRLMVSGGRTRAKVCLTAGMIGNFGALLLFKYSDFLVEAINGAAAALSGEGAVIEPPHLLLPIGISFYTFQAAAYLIDVYRGTCQAEKNILYFGTYLAMFPKLISGPIARYGEIRERLAKRGHSLRKFLHGAEIFIVGLGFKVLLANRLGGLWNNIAGIGYESISTPLAWLGIVGYSLQIYFDFYGYSLMAIGLGKMMGFSLPVNFRHPYISCTMTEFWRRWHITLGAWFRDYVYIPLGGNRKGRGRMFGNMFVVWLLTGLWHGADWNFLLWGLFLFAVMAVEKLFLGKILEEKRFLGHLYMILLIPISWLIFAVSDLQQLGIYFGRLVGLGGVSVYAGDFVKYMGQYGIYLVIGLLFCTRVPEALFARIRNRKVRWILLALILAGAVYGIRRGMNDPFLYFRF